MIPYRGSIPRGDWLGLFATQLRTLYVQDAINSHGLLYENIASNALLSRSRERATSPWRPSRRTSDSLLLVLIISSISRPPHHPFCHPFFHSGLSELRWMLHTALLYLPASNIGDPESRTCPAPARPSGRGRCSKCTGRPTAMKPVTASPGIMTPAGYHNQDCPGRSGRRKAGQC